MKIVSAVVSVVLCGAITAQASELHLLGLKINHSQMGNIDALWQDERYYISLSDLSLLDTTAKQQADGWHFDTPLGRTVLASDVVVWQNMRICRLTLYANLALVPLIHRLIYTFI